MTVQIEIKEEIVAKLRTQAAALNVSLEEYLEKIAFLFPLIPTNGVEAAYSGPTPYELAGDLIGAFDSSVPDTDPDAQPRHTNFGAHLLRQYKAQIEKIS